MAAKILSQKKFSKLVSSTGSLSQPPGALARLSNLIFTTRGSLQIASGSKAIGQLPPPSTAAVWIASFDKYSSGQYPFYPALAFPPAGYLVPNVTNFSAGPNLGAATNAPGIYYFAIVANNGAYNSAPVIAYLSTALPFPGVTFLWSAAPGAATYDIYYIASPGAGVGNKIIAATAGTPSGGSLGVNFTGALAPDTTVIPQVNNSFLLEFLIGSVAPPSQLVNFVPVTNFLSIPPQPAQLAPGDPNFTFNTINTSIQTLLPSSSGGTASATSNSGSPTNTQTTVVATGWAASPTTAGQSITVNMQVSGSASISTTIPPTQGGGAATYEYSADGGTTWTTIGAFSTNIGTWSLALPFTVPASVLTDLSNLQIRIVAIAQWGYGSGSINISGSATAGISITTSTSSSFSPYGGIPGLACVIPMEVQFASKEILILGNGYAPQQCDPSLLGAATLTALANTFTAAYPTWQPSVDWITGAQLSALYGSVNYLFTATQGGVSGSGSTPFTGTPPAQGSAVADGSVIWTSQGPIASSVAPRGAAHAVAYAGSLWLANTSPQTTSDGIDGPTCIKMSDSNNPNSWNPLNTAFIGRDDGTQITGLQPFTIAALGISPTGSLCVFKEFQTYQVIGVFGSTSFDIQPAQTNLGCIVARSIQFLPGFGVVRYTHLGFAVFDGINDRLISEDIRPYLFGGVDSEADLVPVDPSYVYLSKSAQTISPPMYLCAMPLAGQSGALTRLFAYDLVMKSWAILDLPWAISSLNAMSTGEGYPLVLAGKIDGAVQRLQSGDLNWDQGATDQSTVQWSFRSPDVFGEGSSQKLFYEMATIRGYGSSAMVASIVANLWLDGQLLGAQAIDVVPQGGSNLFEARVKMFHSGYRAHIDFSGNNGGAAGVIDAIDWAIVPKSSLARRIIS